MIACCKKKVYKTYKHLNNNNNTNPCQPVDFQPLSLRAMFTNTKTKTTTTTKTNVTREDASDFCLLNQE